MGNAIENEACSSLAGLFASHLGRAVSSACGNKWEIALADPQSESTPTIESPVLYQLHFSQGLRGRCYLVIGKEALLLFTAQPSPSQPAAGSKSKAAKVQVLSDEAQSAAMQALVHEVVTALPEGLAANHGIVTIEDSLCQELDPLAVHVLQLSALDANGAAAALLLHFDPELLDSLAAPGPEAGRAGAEAGASGRANLELVLDVELSCTLRFGQRQLSLREILDLASGSVVELDRQVDEPVELILDGKVIARGEAVIIDGNYGLRVTQVVQPAVY